VTTDAIKARIADAAVTAIDELLAAADAEIERFEASCQCAPVSGCLDAQRRHGLIAAAGRVRAELASGEISDDQLAQTYLDARAAEIARPAEPGRLCEPHAKGLRAVEHAVRASTCDHVWTAASGLPPHHIVCIDCREVRKLMDAGEVQARSSS